MAKRVACLFLLLVVLGSSSGCFSGPWRLRKSWEDNSSNWYGENAWLHGALLQDILPVYPIVTIVMAIGDFLVVNPYYFWSHDAWTNHGTVFQHGPTNAESTVTNAFDNSASAWQPKQTSVTKPKPKTQP